MAALRHARARAGARHGPLQRVAAQAPGSRGSAAPMSRQIAWALLAAVVILLAAGAWHQYMSHAIESGAVVVGGGDAGGLPRADARSEGFDARALQAVVATTRTQQSGGLLITRHGHLVVDSYSGSAHLAILIRRSEVFEGLVMLAGRPIGAPDR